MEKGSAQAQQSAAPIAELLQCAPISRLLARFDAAQREADGAAPSASAEPQLSWMDPRMDAELATRGAGPRDAPRSKRRKQAAPRRAPG